MHGLANFNLPLHICCTPITGLLTLHCSWYLLLAQIAFQGTGWNVPTPLSTSHTWQSHQCAHICLWYVQKEVTAVLLEGDKGGQQLEGVAMKGTIAKRFEELDWDNNGVALQTL